jgi:hypothetical protein
MKLKTIKWIHGNKMLFESDHKAFRGLRKQKIKNLRGE